MSVIARKTAFLLRGCFFKKNKNFEERLKFNSYKIRRRVKRYRLVFLRFSLYLGEHLITFFILNQ